MTNLTTNTELEKLVDLLKDKKADAVTLFSLGMTNDDFNKLLKSLRTSND